MQVVPAQGSECFPVSEGNSFRRILRFRVVAPAAPAETKLKEEQLSHSFLPQVGAPSPEGLKHAVKRLHGVSIQKLYEETVRDVWRPSGGLRWKQRYPNTPSASSFENLLEDSTLPLEQ